VKLFVGNLSRDVTDDVLLEAFQAYGTVASATVIRDKFSGESRGFGFVEFAENAEAQAAVENLNGKELLGRAMTVNEARPREDRPRGGGGGRRFGTGGGGNRSAGGPRGGGNRSGGGRGGKSGGSRW